MDAWITDYLLFLLKSATVVGAVGGLMILTAILLARNIGAMRGTSSRRGRLTVKKLNDRFASLAEALSDAALPGKAAKAAQKARSKAAKAREKGEDSGRKRVFVVDFKGDRRASGVASLRQEITAIVGAAQDGDEVVVRLESPGGGVSDYGLAASQLERLRQAKIKLTVVVDKVAASGGYMMAVVADRIIAAPFSVVGSIGVVVGMPNFHRWLTKRNVDWEQITAGKYKRTLTVMGENTDAGREKMQADMDEVHNLFKQLVGKFRPNMNLDEVATGEWWLGQRALELGLIDALGTSDDVLLNRQETADVLHIKWEQPQRISGRLAVGMETLITRFFDAIAAQKGL